MLSPIYTPKAMVAKVMFTFGSFPALLAFFNQTKLLLHAEVEAVYCNSPAKMSASHSNAAPPEGGSARSNTGLRYSVPSSAATLLS